MSSKEKRIGKKRKHCEPLDNDDTLLLCVKKKKKKEHNQPLPDYKENDTATATLLKKKKKHKKHKKKERKSRDTSPPPSQQQQQPIKDDKMKTSSVNRKGYNIYYLKYRESFINDLQQDIDYIDMKDTFEEKHKQIVYRQYTGDKHTIEQLLLLILFTCI